ncbi:MAG: tRNA-dihydrouridine synthase [bacterium]|nr:tRNA-dihydrouridine synthase [bacterium]
MSNIAWDALHPNVRKLFQCQSRPVLALAPMEDVTILPFRRIMKRNGADLVYTEFIAAAGLVREIASCIKKLEYEESERPLTVQIYGSNPDEMARAAKMVERLVQPEFIDINLGCPVKKIAGRGDGAGLLKPDSYNSQIHTGAPTDLPPKNLEAVVCSVVDAVSTPVTVKMRLGWDERTIYVVESMPWFKSWGVQFIALHARTRAQAYTGKANWDYVKLAKAASELPIIGNGDLVSAELIKQRWEETGCDGLMIGRGAITQPWLFRDAVALLEGKPLPPAPTLRERVEQYIGMIVESIPMKGEFKAVIEMRKYLPGFLSGAYNAAHVRREIVQMNTLSEVETRLFAYVTERETDQEHQFQAHLAREIDAEFQQKFFTSHCSG